MSDKYEDIDLTDEYLRELLASDGLTSLERALIEEVISLREDVENKSEIGHHLFDLDEAEAQRVRVASGQTTADDQDDFIDSTAASLIAALRQMRAAYAELYGTEQWLRHEWEQANEIIDRVAALLDQREDEHADFLRRIETGEVIMLDRFIGPPQVLVRDMREAIGDTL